MAPTLPELIAKSAQTTRLINGEDADTIGLAAVALIAEQLSIPGWQVESEALAMCTIPLRYLRNMSSITMAMQQRLLQSRIAQVGLGGLGGTLLEIYLRTGIGRIRVADGDSFDESNLNRQTLSMPENLGTSKAKVARQIQRQLNPSVELDARKAFLSAKDLPPFIQGCSVAVDAMGGLQTRLALQQAASDAGVPLVTGALAGWTGYISVVPPGGTGPADIMGTNNSAEETLGCPASAVSFFASIMGTETIKLLTKDVTPLSGHMLVCDLKALSFDRIAL